MIKICLVLALVLGGVLNQSPPPQPYCKSKPIIQILPLTVGEIIDGDLSNAFNGYNLDISIKQGGDVAKTVNKLELKNEINGHMGTLISAFVQHRGNSFGTYGYVLVEDAGLVQLQLYSVKNGTFSFEKTITVLYEPNTVCFDAAVFMDSGIAIIDCAEISGKSSNFVGIKNKFVYINIATDAKEKVVYNDMYESFTSITRRKFTRYHDPHTGYEYIIRTYFANGVDEGHRGNTYIEYWSAYDIQDLQIMRVIDRSYLGLDELAIVDFKVYLGDMFMLDYFRGVYRLDITHGQHIVITGRYQGEFFTKMSVYSDDLDEQVLLALSNEHSVYEINMDKPIQPLLLYKYSLLQHSRVHNIIVDEKYLVVQASANVSDDANKTTLLNYTWIFTKGSRTYMNAYKVINHNSSDVFVDMNRHNNELVTFDEKGMKHYKINDVIIYFQQKDNTTLGKTYDIQIFANSSDPIFGTPTNCTETTQVVMVDPLNMTIWPTKIPLSDTYYTNYPGRLEIFLDRYVIGPNITYNVEETMIHKDLPTHWINQQNQTFVHIDKPPRIGEINFFYSEVVPHYGNETVIYFYQDLSNTTTVAYCVHVWEDVNINCTVQASYSHTGRIDQFSTAIFNFDNEWRYYYIWTLASSRSPVDSINTVYIIDFIKHQRLATLELPNGYEGYVGDIATSNGILYLLLPYMKTIVAYRLDSCIEFVCKQSFTIDHNSLKNQGIDFFAPTDITTTRHHPEVLFIQCYGSVIILDVDNSNNLILLDQITSDQSDAVKLNDYKLAVNNDYLVVIASPNIIEEYSLENLYTNRKVTFFKRLPLYNYTIPADFDIEFSDVGDLFYINTVDTAVNLTTVLIYRTGAFSVSSLYDVINVPGLYSHKNLEIEVSGYFVDFVSIIASGAFYVYLQFEVPFMVMESDVIDFQFYLHFMNHETSQKLSLVTVNTTNYPSGFVPTPEFTKIKDNLKGSEGSLTWDTRKWFDGHVARYNYSCTDCHDRITLISHIHNIGVLRIGGADYSETFFGGLALWEDLFRLRVNGSIGDVLLLPDAKKGERCIKSVSTPDDIITVTGCRINSGGTHVYITSTVGHKGFTYGPFLTSAYNIENLQIVNQLLVVTDVDMFPQFRLRTGGVYLYALNLDPISLHELDEIDYIDGNDFQGAHGWDEDDVYVGNSHLMFDTYDETYRLYVTELYHGLFVMDFKFKFGARDINIITTAFVDLNKLLNEHNFHMPNDAYFLAVTHTGFKYNPVMEVENILVTTSGYHNFEITLIYDEKGQLVSQILHRVYYRYAYYQAHNYVRAANGYFAIAYVIPPVFEYMTDNTKQLITLYDTKDYEGEFEKGYSERYMLGGHGFNHTDQCAFGFNTTIDRRNNGTRIGLVMIDGVSDRMWEASISRNLSFEVKGGAPAQKVAVVAFSDFHKESFEIEVEKAPGPEPDDGGLGAWRIVLIVLGSLVAAGFIAYIIFLCYKKRRVADEEANPLAEGLHDDEEDGSAERVPALNESVAYSESVRNTIEPIRDTFTEPRAAEPAQQAPPADVAPPAAVASAPPAFVEAPPAPAQVPPPLLAQVPPPLPVQEPNIELPAEAAPAAVVQAPPAPAEGTA